MLTPLDLKTNYFALLAESESITGITLPTILMDTRNYINVTQETSLTTKQWDNLVKVASIIKENVNRFDMEIWHKETECGTCHCIAGWAQSLEENDTNYNASGARFVAGRMLSKFVSPFFWVSTSILLCYDDGLVEKYEGLAEKLVMKYLIDPVLEEARRESYEISSELTQFIERAQKEVVTV